MLTILSLVAIVVFGTILFIRFREDTAESIYNRIEFWRKTGGLLLLVAVAWTFLRSGRPELIFISLVSISLATMYFYIERPTETLS